MIALCRHFCNVAVFNLSSHGNQFRVVLDTRCRYFTFGGTVRPAYRTYLGMSAAKSKPTEAELVEAAVNNIKIEATSHKLIDIGINLADSSYDKVQHETSNVALTCLVT